jgi:hypothetical protein
VCAASIVLFFVSARFRLPLAALAAIMAGGALAAPGFWRAWPRRSQSALAAALLFAAALAFSSFDRVRDRVTFVEDHSLLARSAATVGDDALAWEQSNAALALQPRHRDALRVAVAAYFNLLVLQENAADAEPRWLHVSTEFLAAGDHEVAELQAIAGVALWRARQTREAVALWRHLGAAPSAVAARLLIGDPSASPRELAAARTPAWEEPLVRLAAARLSIRPPAGISTGNEQRAADVVARIFGSPSRRE